MSDLFIGQQEHITSCAKVRRRCRLFRWAEVICALVVLSLSGSKHLPSRIEIASSIVLLIFWMHLLLLPAHRPIMPVLSTCSRRVMMNNGRRRVRWRWTVREGGVGMRWHWLLIIGMRLFILVVSHALISALPSGSLCFVVPRGASSMVVLANTGASTRVGLLVVARVRLLIVATVVVLLLVWKIGAVTCRRVASHAASAMPLK